MLALSVVLATQAAVSWCNPEPLQRDSRSAPKPWGATVLPGLHQGANDGYAVR
jgi:hypothetical protein